MWVRLNCVWLFVTPWTVTYQALLSIGILQARIQEWGAMPSSRGSSQPRDQTQISCIAGRFFTISAAKEAPKHRRGAINEWVNLWWMIIGHVSFSSFLAMYQDLFLLPSCLHKRENSVFKASPSSEAPSSVCPHLSQDSAAVLMSPTFCVSFHPLHLSPHTWTEGCGSVSSSSYVLSTYCM